MFHVIAVLAEFERDIIQERTLAGLEAARARGRKGGRPKATSTIRSGDLARAQALYAAKENTVAEIMQLTGFKNRSTFYKYVVNERRKCDGKIDMVFIGFYYLFVHSLPLMM